MDFLARHLRMLKSSRLCLGKHAALPKPWLSSVAVSTGTWSGPTAKLDKNGPEAIAGDIFRMMLAGYKTWFGSI